MSLSKGACGDVGDVGCELAGRAALLGPGRSRAGTGPSQLSSARPGPAAQRGLRGLDPHTSGSAPATAAAPGAARLPTTPGESGRPGERRGAARRSARHRHCHGPRCQARPSASPSSPARHFRARRPPRPERGGGGGSMVRRRRGAGRGAPGRPAR